MASPQKENGYTKIANEILEKLCEAGINGSEYRIVLCVLRKTYGYNKIKDKISLSQFQKITGMRRANVVRTVKSLVAKRILVKEKNLYKFNKNWEEWGVSKRITYGKVVAKRITGSSQTATKSSSQTATHKRKKETNTKENPANYRLREIEEIIYSFKEVNPSYKKYFNNKTQRAAAERLTKEHGKDKVISMIAFLPKSNSERYAPTITTPLQLEDKLGQLIAWAEKLKSNKKNIIGL